MARAVYDERQVEKIRSKMAALPDRPAAQRLELDKMIQALRPEIEQRIKTGWAVREIAAELAKLSEIKHREATIRAAISRQIGVNKRHTKSGAAQRTHTDAPAALRSMR